MIDLFFVVIDMFVQCVVVFDVECVVCVMFMCYMVLCDVFVDVGVGLLFVDLFMVDVVWEGIGL